MGLTRQDWVDIFWTMIVVAIFSGMIYWVCWMVVPADQWRGYKKPPPEMFYKP